MQNKGSVNYTVHKVKVTTGGGGGMREVVAVLLTKINLFIYSSLNGKEGWALQTGVVYQSSMFFMTLYSWRFQKSWPQ